MGQYRKKGLALAMQLGAIVICDEPHEVEVEAPPNMTWKCNPGVHSLVTSRMDEDETWEQLWKDMWERMDLGIEPCECKDCEWCSPEKGESNGEPDGSGEGSGTAGD